MKLSTLDAYIHEGDYIVLRPHGSIGWQEEVDSPGNELTGGDVEQANRLIDLSGRYQRTGRYAMPGQDLLEWGPRGPLRPAIAVPMVTKTGDDFACPRTHIQVLHEVVPYVSQLVVVGWRGAEGHFHERWRSAAANKTVLQKVLIVDAGDKAARQVEETLKPGLKIGGGVLWNREINGFSSFVEGSAVKSFLAAS
jgi:hypothetical protein